MTLRARYIRRARRGFTLPELIVGSVIVAMIATSVVIALSQSLDAERRSRARQEAVSRANAAADRIARDARALARTHDLVNTRLWIRDARKGADEADELLMVATASRTPLPAQPDAPRRPTGGTYEVQYRLFDDPRREGVPGGDQEPASVLRRRVDDLPDEFIDAGGIDYPVVVGVRSVKLQAFDGEDWLDTWDTDLAGYPYALRIEVRATSDDGSVTDRVSRIVPFDRVPLPITPILDAGGA